MSARRVSRMDLAIVALAALMCGGVWTGVPDRHLSPLAGGVLAGWSEPYAYDDSPWCIHLLGSNSSSVRFEGLNLSLERVGTASEIMVQYCSAQPLDPALCANAHTLWLPNAEWSGRSPKPWWPAATRIVGIPCPVRAGPSSLLLVALQEVRVALSRGRLHQVDVFADDDTPLVEAAVEREAELIELLSTAARSAPLLSVEDDVEWMREVAAAV